MIKFTQSKVSIVSTDKKECRIGNCNITTLACLMDIDPIDLPNLETLYPLMDNHIIFCYGINEKELNWDHLWVIVMQEILKFYGWEKVWANNFRVFHPEQYEVIDWFKENKDQEIEKHKELLKDQLYLVSGISPRGFQHICIYKNGELFWDVHPSKEGLVKEESWELLKKIGDETLPYNIKFD